MIPKNHGVLLVAKERVEGEALQGQDTELEEPRGVCVLGEECNEHLALNWDGVSCT